MKIKTKEYKIRKYVGVEYSKLPCRGIYVYRVTTKTIEKFETTHVVEGICKYKDLDTLKDKIPKCEWVLVPPSLLKEIQRYGYLGNYSEKRAGVSVWDNISDTPFTAFTKRENKELIRRDWASNMVFDKDNEALPMAIDFDYIEAQMHEKSYDLAQAIEILSKREDIKDLSGILEIPHYNTERGKRQYINFTWVPSIKDYQCAWELCKKLDKEFPSTVFLYAIFELDLLGLRRGGAARFGDFYGGV